MGFPDKIFDNANVQMIFLRFEFYYLLYLPIDDMFICRAAEILTNDNVPHVLAAVDATLETDLAARFKIQGYPTIKFFRRGVEVETYSGSRKTADFVQYINSKVAELRNEL